MKKPAKIILFAFASLLSPISTGLHAEVVAPVVTNAWVKTTPPGSVVSGAYMSIKSATPMKLVRAETTAAGLVEIHSMSMKDNVMDMKAIDAIDIPAGKAVELKPGGLHVMLMKITRSINAGDSVPLVLTFEGADKKPVVVKVNATARDRAAPAATR